MRQMKCDFINLWWWQHVVCDTKHELEKQKAKDEKKNNWHYSQLLAMCQPVYRLNWMKTKSKYIMQKSDLQIFLPIICVWHTNIKRNVLKYMLINIRYTQTYGSIRFGVYTITTREYTTITSIAIIFNINTFFWLVMEQTKLGCAHQVHLNTFFNSII